VFNLHGKLSKYKAKFDALISAHYTAAVILHDKTLTLAQFEPARYDDPKLRRAAAAQVEIKPDSALPGVQALVEIEMVDGRVFAARCEHPRGSYENPLTRAQIEDKFRIYAKGVLADAATDEILAAVNRLEEMPSARRLMELLRVPTQNRATKVA
jgi:2-methylcitrate dehydratase PrpD